MFEQISNRSQTDLKQISNRSQTDLKQISEHRTQNTEHRTQNTEHRTQTPEHNSAISWRYWCLNYDITRSLLPLQRLVSRKGPFCLSEPLQKGGSKAAMWLHARVFQFSERKERRRGKRREKSEEKRGVY